jgi:uncharacterized MAPEG superfamily protein
MTTPLWVLLAFAVWTLAVLMAGIGISRWSLILSGRAQLTDFPADQPHGAPAYRRAVRAHANCVENLPVFGAIVFALYVSGVSGPTVNYLATSILIARVIQSLIHVCFVQTNTVVAFRFSFFSVQFLSFVALIAMVVRSLSKFAPPL